MRGVIEDERPRDRERGERLAAEAAERLREEDFSDVLARPFGEAVAGIVRDLGLSPDWLTLAEDCAAAEAALAGKPGKVPEEEPYTGPIEVRWIGEDDDDPPAREPPPPDGPISWKERRLGRRSS